MDDLELMHGELMRAGVDYVAKSVQNEEEFTQALQDFRPDLILSDYRIPGFDGLAALAIARQRYPEIGFIIVSGVLGEELAIESLKRGATDYVLKDRLHRLAPEVQRALQEARQRKIAREAEAALKESEAKFAALAEHVSAIIYIHQEGQFKYVNPAAEQILGYPRSELLGMKFWDVIDPGARQAVRERGLQREAGAVLDTLSEFQIVRKSGETRWLECIACRIELGGRWAVLGSAFDITARKHAEEVLRASEEKFRSLFESAPIGMALLEPNGHLAHTNRAFQQMLGFSNEELLELGMKKITYEADIPAGQSFFEEFCEGKRDLYQREKRFVAKDGRVVWGRSTVSAVRKADGELTHIIAIVEDITARKRAAACNAAFAKVGLLLSAANTSSEAAGIIVDVAAELFGWDACYLHLCSQDRTQIIPILTMDTMDGVKTQIPEQSFTLDPSPLMLDVMAKGSRLVSRQSLSPEITLVPFGNTNRPSASMMYVPIRLGAKAIGIASIQSYTPHAYSMEDLKNFQALADYCAGALQRIQMANALRESELKNRLLLEANPHWMFRISRNGTVIDYKAPKKFAAEAMTLRLVGTDVFSAWPTELMKRFRHYLDEAMTSRREQSFDFEFRILGELCHFDAQLVAIDEEEALAIVRDVSDRKRLENELLQISERERLHLGQDLHDGLCQTLIGVRLKLLLLTEQLERQALPEAQQLTIIIQWIDGAANDARNLALGLSPLHLHAGGLSEALRHLAVTTESMFHVWCQCFCAKPIEVKDEAVATHVYRIAQEAVSNAAKHAEASCIVIALRREGECVILTITDNGKGTPPASMRREGMGLRIMTYRAQLIGSTLRVEARRRGGTRVVCKVRTVDS